MTGEVFTRRIFGTEVEYGLTATTPDGRRVLGPEEVARYLFRPVFEEHRSTNIFLPNAARLYLDVGAHPEYATAECDALGDLIAQERAGDLLFHRLAGRAEAAMAAEGIPARVHLLRNNVDRVGNSFGCHENYLLGRSAVLRRLGRELVPFLVTRQLICGAGAVSRGADDEEPRFLLSQRADHVREGVSSATTRSRPMINTRDEPHADSRRFRRMHVIVGDTNVAEPSIALKIGATLMVLELIEAGLAPDGVAVPRAEARIREIARDPRGATPLELEDGGCTTALELQRSWCEAAGSWLERRPAPTRGVSTAELRRVHGLWCRVLDAVAAGDPAAIAGEIDWAAKLTLLEAARERSGAAWSDPRLARIDLAYHDIHPERGLRALLERRGRLRRWVEQEAVERATREAPAGTRAAVRGAFVSRARELGAPITVDWARLKVNRPEPRVVELADPFSADPVAVEPLMRHLEEHFGAGGRP